VLPWYESIQFFSHIGTPCFVVYFDCQFRPAELAANDTGKKDDNGGGLQVIYLNFLYFLELIINSFEFGTNHGTRIHSFVHRNKENEPTTLNGTVAPPTRRLRDTSKNPYSKDYCKPRSSIATTASRPSTAKATTSKASSATLATVEEEETSPTIRRILEKTGCSSRQELLAMHAAQEANTNANRAKPAAINRAKSSATNRSKSTNGPNNATNGAPNVSKTATKGAKATNPKKKSKSKYLYLKYTLVALDAKMKMMSLIHLFPLYAMLNCTGFNATATNGSKATNTKATNGNGSKSANGSKITKSSTSKASPRSHGTLLPFDSYVTLSIQKQSVSLTLPITF